MTRIDSTPVVALDSVGKRFGERWVLRGAALRVGAGERVALLGESGAGKSTLLNLIAGLETPDEGEVRILGQALDARDADAAAALRRRLIGFVFQAFHLLPYLSVWQNIGLPLLLLHEHPRRARERAQALLERVGLGDRADARPGELSGGEQQRVALLRALAHRPALLLADEPTGNLDPASARTAIALMDELVRDTGAAMVMVTHSRQAAASAQRIIRIEGATIHEGIGDAD